MFFCAHKYMTATHHTPFSTGADQRRTFQSPRGPLSWPWEVLIPAGPRHWDAGYIEDMTNIKRSQWGDNGGIMGSKTNIIFNIMYIYNII